MTEVEAPRGHPVRAGDGALVQAVRRGDDRALDQLVERYAGHCLALASGILGDADLAEDVVQETFVQLWRRSGELDPVAGSIGGWCLRVTRNRAIDELRRRRVRSALPLEVSGRHQASGADTAAEALRRLRQQEVREALGQLSAPQQEAVRLAFLGGLTHSEIATLLEIPLGTAKTRVRQGLLRLQVLLRDPWEAVGPTVAGAGPSRSGADP